MSQPAEFDARQDNNQNPALIGHAGTAGTAQTRRVVVSDAGAVHTTAQGTSSVSISGTVPVAVTSGTTTVGGGYLDSIINGTIATNLLPLSGVVLAGTLGVATTATPLPATALSGRKSMIVYNEGTTRLFLGGSGVTSATGLPVGTADYSPSFDIGTTVMYGICVTAGGTARVLEVS